MEWVQIKLTGNKTLLVSSFYMPHGNMSGTTERRRSLEGLKLDNRDRTVIIAGDFNCPDIDWESLSVQNTAQDKDVQQALIDLKIDFNLTQVHDQPTRENNLLDLVFNSTINAPGISDHDMVIVDTDTKPFYTKQRPRKCFIFSRANLVQLKTNISETSAEIQRLYNLGKSVHELWNTFKGDLNTGINENIPSKMKKSKQSTPWITRNLKRQMKRKARLFKKAKRTKNWTQYRKFQKECKRQLRQAEWTYINTVINEGLQNNNTKPL